jgi:ribonucleoside-diphosphate reductase alpha chain
MSREPLPHRRLAETFDFEISGLHYTCTIGRYPDGRLAEIFLQNTKAGSQSDGNARESAIAASLALQFGCPSETLRGAVLRNPNGSPCTPLGAALDHVAEFQQMRAAKEI